MAESVDLLGCRPPTSEGPVPQGVRGAFNRNFHELQSKTFTFHGTGADVNSVFPFANQVALLTFQADAQFVGATMFASLINPVASSVVGVYLFKNGNPINNVSASQDKLLEAVTLQNSLALATPSPSSRHVSISFQENMGYIIRGGNDMSIGATAPNDATVEIFAICTIYFKPF